METCNIHLMSTELFSGLVKKSFFASLSCFFDQLRHSFIEWLLHLKNILGVCFVRKILWYLKLTFFFIKGKLNCNWTDINCSREHFRNSYEKLTQTLNFKRAHLSLDFYFFFEHVCFIIWANFFIIIFFFHNRGLGRSDLRVLWSHWSSTLQEDIEHRGGAQQWPLRDNEILSEQSRWGRRWEWQTGTLVNPI